MDPIHRELEGIWGERTLGYTRELEDHYREHWMRDRAKSYIETSDDLQFKDLDRNFGLDFSKYDWELGYESVKCKKILQYICEKRPDFVRSQGWHILVKAVRAKNLESVRYLIDEQDIDPDQLESVAFVSDQYHKLIGKGSNQQGLWID